MVRDLFHFLGVDDTFEPDVTLRHQAGGVRRSRAVHRLLAAKDSSLKEMLKSMLPPRVRERIRHWIRDMNRHKPEMSPATRRRLIEEYREDILKLQDLIQRDLSHWLSTAE